MGLWDLVAQGLRARLSGPFHLRFIVQPLVAIVLGIRDGLRDARTEQPPYVIAILYDHEHRGELLAGSIRNLIKPMVVGVLVDLVFQYAAFGRVRLLPALIVGSLVLGLPYVAARGFTNRIASRRRRRG